MNKQITLSKDKSGLSDTLYSLRVSIKQEKEGKSPLEKPNTVKSNVVKGLMDISEQDPQLELNSSDLQDELVSTVLVRERESPLLKTGAVFSKKAGRVIRETAHTITILPESSGAPKTVFCRIVPVARKEQKDRVEKSGNRRATVIESTTSSSENEQPPKKKTKKKKSRQVPEMAFDLEEIRPQVEEISSTSTRVGEEKESGVKQEVEKTNSSGNEQINQNAQVPVRATTSWEVNRKGTTRTLEKRRVPTKRYGIDIITKAKNMKNESDTE